MNPLEIAALILVAVFGLIGYRTGLLRMLYSLFAWAFVLAFVTWSTPYLTKFLEENTGIETVIQEQAVTYLESLAEKEMGETAGIFGILMEGTGIYDGIAAEAAHYIVEGIAFFLAFFVIGVLTRTALHMLDAAAHLPVLKETNRNLGAAAGCIKGVVILWLLFYLISLIGGSKQGAQLQAYIDDSIVLRFLYENNLLFLIAMKFL